MIGVLARVLKDLAVDGVDPVVETVERFDRAGVIDVHAQMPHAAETGRDVEGDVIVGRPAGKPWP